MDPFLLTVWIVRLLFLALLYLFLFRIARALVGDLRAAAREPGAELGRLVVMSSPSGEPEEGTSLTPHENGAHIEAALCRRPTRSIPPQTPRRARRPARPAPEVAR